MAESRIMINVRKIGREKKIKLVKSPIQEWGKKYMCYEQY